MFSSALKSFSSNITQNYTLSAHPSSTAGAWKVFDGKSKKTGKTVSVFVFDRKALESGGGSLDGGRSSAATRRKVYDEVVDRLKKEAGALARLRHPNILELAEPVEEMRGGGLMFATEPITATLASLLRDLDNKEAGRSRKTRYKRDEDGEQKEMELDELEIQKGMLQVAKGLQFLHESAGLVHANLSPDAIYVNQKSDWKISALAFAGPADDSNSTAASSASRIALSELLYYDPRLPRAVQLDINFTSPDFVMDTTVSTGADMFSLGLIMIALYTSPHESPLKTNNNISSYKKLFSSSSTVPSSSNNFLSSKPLPRVLQSDILPRLITRRAAQRMTAREFQESSFFDNILVNTLRFVDSFPAKSPSEKTQFLRGLPRVLEQFPKSVLQKKILPALLEETKDKELLSMILTDVFKIIQLVPSPQRVVSDRVLPKLQETFPVATKSANQERDTAKEGGLAVVLDNVALMADTCAGKEFKDYILPIVLQGMEASTHSLVDKALRCLPSILKVLDFSTIKNELFPVIAAVFSKTSSLAIKIRGLEAFVLLCGGSNEQETIEDSASTNKATILDKYTVQEKVVPLLKGIKTKEPSVMMAALAVFKQIGKIADAEFLATEVLPILWSFGLGPLLNMQQFQQYMDLTKTTSSRIETEHTRKLRSLAAESANINETSISNHNNDLMSLPNDGPFSPTGGNVGEDDFARLVLGKGGSSTGGGGASDLFSSQPQSQPITAASSSNMNTINSPPVSKPVHDFGWASNKPALQPQSNSRAITPDHTASNSMMSSYPVMSPGTGTGTNANSMGMGMSMGGRPALQPTSSSSSIPNAFGTSSANTWSSPPLQQPQQQQGPNYNAWSTTNTPNANAGTGSGSGWSLPPPPSGGSSFGQQTQQSNGMGRGMGMGMGMGGMSSSGMGMGGGGGLGMSGMNGMAANKPPGVGAGWGQQALQPQGPQQQQSQQQQQQKSGLDKYQSLI